MTWVRVVFHAEFRRAAGVKEAKVEILGPATVRDVLSMIKDQIPVLEVAINQAIAQGLGNDMVVAIDGQVATLDTSVRPGNQLRLLPPISGG